MYEGFSLLNSQLFGVRGLLDTSIKVVYKTFGLSVQSEIVFPELSRDMDQYDERVDILIEKKDSFIIKDKWSFPRNKFIVEDNLVMFDVPNIAIFSIEDGRKITVFIKEGYDEDIARLYILGTCMGALLMQRKVFPLHGSAVAVDGKAYVFIGDSGAGKSTLATTFLKRGYQLLSDDVIAISLSVDQTPFVTPAYPQQKLWQESLVEFGMEASQYRSIYGRETKFCVPVPSQYFKTPLPIAGIFELVKTEKEEIQVHHLQGLERLQTLSYHTYRNFLIPGLGLWEWHFNTSASIANQIEIFRLLRPISGFSAPQLASIILDTLHRGG